MVVNDELHSVRLRYLMRILSERWPNRADVLSVLDISRDMGALTAGLARQGYRVTAIKRQHTSLEWLGGRLGCRTDVFDVVTCCTVLGHADDRKAS